MNRWITIVGIGEDGAEGLGTRAREVIANAEILIGGERHLALIPEGAAARANWGKDFEHGVAAIRAHEGKRVVVLASGDPLHFGVGVTLLQRFGVEAVEIMPAPGAFSLAAARLGWSIPDVTCLTVHGRALESVNLHLRPGGRLMILEFSRVDNDILSWFYDKYSFGVIPLMGEVVAGDRKSYQYLVESIRKFPDQEDFLEMIKDIGFYQVKFRILSFGVAALHSAWKI